MSMPWVRSPELSSSAVLKTQEIQQAGEALS